MSDNGSEFRSAEFRRTVAQLGAEHRFIHAGRPQTNGCVERVQGTILDECWKPAFARSRPRQADHSTAASQSVTWRSGRTTALLAGRIVSVL